MTDDVLICGGGLSGLTLAHQLARRAPGLKLRVLEKQVGPLPVAAFKVGESAVELGSEYLFRDIGLGEHLRSEQLPKMGLRFWLGTSRESDFSGRTEFGPKQPPAVPSLHVDRGLLEQNLRDALPASVTFEEGVNVVKLDIASGGAKHTVHYVSQDGTTRSVNCHWLIDASGRRRLLQTQLGLQDDARHVCSSAWWRVEGLQDVSRMLPAERGGHAGEVERWMSTNHLMGDGYWVWMIPLSSNCMSLGIVADQASHPIAEYNTLEKANEWLRRHEPGLAKLLSGATVKDFHALKKFSYWSRQIFSRDRWACSGDAAVFVDPLYSPGTDLIAISNSAICEMIAAEQQGQLSDRDVESYNRLVLSDIGENALELYRDNYRTFESVRVTVAKTHWDTCYYWAFPCALFFAGRLDRDAVGAYAPLAQRFLRLNRRVQQLFRDWYDATKAKRHLGASFIAYSGMPFFRDLQSALKTKRASNQVFEKMHEDLRKFECWARVLYATAASDALEVSLSLDEVAAIDPYHSQLSAIENGTRASRTPDRFLQEMHAQHDAFIDLPSRSQVV